MDAQTQKDEQSHNGLGKLLTKSISKRRRRKQKQQPGNGTPTSKDGNDSGSGRHLTLLDSDGNSSLVPSDDDRSFGSYESNLELSAPELSQSSTAVSSSVPVSRTTTEDSAVADHEKSRSPSRPPPVSAHPSLIGYLTTSSPEVQATTNLEAQSPSELPSLQANRPSSSRSSPFVAVDRNKPLPEPVQLESAPSGKLRGSDSQSRRMFRSDPKPPRTPPTHEDTAPIIVQTPPSPVEGSRPSNSGSPERKTVRAKSSAISSLDGPSLGQNAASHRRSRSGSATIVPSKLSTITQAPVTPTPEDVERPGSASSPSGFFSSVFTAAQNAATNITTNIQNTGLPTLGGNKSRTSLNKVDAPPTPPSHVEVESAPEAKLDPMEQKESAVRTLGAGDLSLSQLGLAEPGQPVPSPGNSRFPDLLDTRARSESAPSDLTAKQGEHATPEPSSRPRSLDEATSEENTPVVSTHPDLADAKSAVQRSSSIRSAIKPHRKRGSSVTTGATIGAAIAAANSSLANPAASNLTAPKLTGFAIASKKRNRDFHTFFKSVPDDDYLIEDYSCALQREILAHGRLYVSEGHLCFSSNILGWMTTLVMSFDEIVSVEKRSTALVFKNGLMISTLHAKHVFASFTSRDATYDLIVNIWKLGHPTLQSTLNGVRLEGTGGDKTEKIDTEPSGVDEDTRLESGSEEDSDAEDDEDDEEFYDEEEHDDLPDTQVTESTAVEGEPEKAVARKASGMPAANGVPEEAAKEATVTPTGGVDFPGPPTHGPTDCGDSASHFDKIMGDEVIPAPLGKVYSLLFGPASTAWVTKFLTVDQKCTELQMEDKKGLSLDNKSRSFNYIKPLYASIGPKQTKCITTETLENLDLEKAANFIVSTQTPDVPSGNVFCVKTRYCLSWADNNATRFQANCTIEWSGKSWLKGPIEKGANDGQIVYFKELVAALRAAVSSKARPAAAANGAPKTKGKRKKSRALQSADDAAGSKDVPKKADQQNWGILEPVRPLLEPIVDILRPILTGNVMYGLLVGLLVATWFGFGITPRKGVAPFGPGAAVHGPYRFAAYEEMWHREDSELWDWLDERVGLDRLHVDRATKPKAAAEARSVEEKLKEQRRSEKDMEEALRVTEEKLRVLREVMARSGVEPGKTAEADKAAAAAP